MSAARSGDSGSGAQPWLIAATVLVVVLIAACIVVIFLSIFRTQDRLTQIDRVLCITAVSQANDDPQLAAQLNKALQVVGLPKYQDLNCKKVG